mmetsp:Transcript_75971/g.180702  ORF Transcript_75971/g.180702 Transcript_75971/m.180702 type:complete len:341 (+) Transcript_75971:157-1179(+)
MLEVGEKMRHCRSRELIRASELALASGHGSRSGQELGHLNGTRSQDFAYGRMPSGGGAAAARGHSFGDNQLVLHSSAQRQVSGSRSRELGRGAELALANAPGHHHHELALAHSGSRSRDLAQRGASDLALALCSGDGSMQAITSALVSRGAVNPSPPALPPPPAYLALPSTEEQSQTHALACSSSAVALPNRSNSGVVGLRTPGGELKSILMSTGHKGEALEGAEKLDLLVWIADQVKENVGRKRKMKLALDQLQEFLIREGMSPKREDAKSIISELLSLRRRELERLDYSKLEFHQEQDRSFELALVALPDETVNECFALVPWQDPGVTVKGSRGCSIM